MKKYIDTELPEINGRIKELIDRYTNGNVRSFCLKMGLNESSKINRLFNRDKRSGEYPIPSTEVIIMIANAYGVSTDWILLGKENDGFERHVNNIDITSTRDVVGDNNTVLGDNNSGNTISGAECMDIIREQQAQISELVKFVLNGKQ